MVKRTEFGGNMQPLARPSARYSGVAIAFHWTIAVLVLFNLLVGLFHDSFAALRELLPVHQLVGFAVLVLTLGRVAWRLSHRAPPLPSDVPDWQKSTAHVTHWAFYVLLVAMPLSGWAMVSGGPPSSAPSLFARIVPSLPVSEAAATTSYAAHELLGRIMAVLVVVHVGAALFHHAVLRTGVLGRMAPAAAR